ncbi:MULTISPECIES: DNA polymerase III subunit alpha [Rhodomicrobium]|uniref:DNA polymerase III subunit alpha n=1 Tax=Rhodomicrobium TaxID=1068 RepID=UPI000B4B5616|nr:MULTISPECIES: DNA polymerase III subunit alpha [Rhodomicrobium]
MAATPGFIHLRLHSAYSLLEGALPVKALAKLAAKDAQPALAVTDRNNLFGALEIAETLVGAGIQPITGCTLSIAAADPEPDAARKNGQAPGIQLAGSIALLVKDQEGYKNLLSLTSAAFIDHPDDTQIHVTWDEIARHNQGLIALTGGPDGPIDSLLREDNHAAARTQLEAMHALFGNRLYIEIQRHGTAEEKRVEAELLKLAYALNIPLAATNQCYFPAREDFEAHEALICIAEGRYISEDERRKLTPEHYFKSRAEMMALFADLPEALDNTIEIARRCAFRPKMRSPILPQFTATDGDKDDANAAETAELCRQAREGLAERLRVVGLAEGASEEDYRTRLEFELNVIATMKFSGYFLIVSDFIKWAKAHGIPVGPGRGSGAGSVAAWSLSITDLDPLRFGLLFERFLNPERVSMPDFDIDFCQDRRDEVIRYVQEKYGQRRVAQIITFGKLQARAVLRDVGRVLQMPYGQVDRLCKLVPNNPANPVTLAEAIEGEPQLQDQRDSDPVVKRLLEIAQKLEGLYRHASTHAAGVVIGDRPLIELVPLYRDPRSTLPVTQFNMKWVEPAGLVKFDFLGLKTLTVIQKALALIKQRGIELDLATLGLDDTKTYELLAKGDTVGVFQLESTGMRESLRKLKPDRFGDIIAMVSLYRPGPMDNIPTYINRKYGLEKVDYMHPLIQPVLEETYGVIIYQEQVMQIAQRLSSYSLGEADLLRRAMGKKIKAEMDKQKARFMEGAIKNGVDKGRADYIFEMVAKFAGYGFNKSHAAAYALLAYHTAFLKANYPVEFLAATMTYDMGNTDKLYLFAQEARRNKIKVLPPSVNSSGGEFLPEDGAIRYSLAALKNIGRGAVEQIAAERAGQGGYRTLADFAERLNPKVLNKRALETLAAAGVFDALEPNRARVYANIEQILSFSGRLATDRASGQSSLFGGGGLELATASSLQLREVPRWDLMETLSHELDAIGFYLSGHPLDDYSDALTRLNIMRWSELEAKLQGQPRAEARIAATVTYKQERRSKSGNRFAFGGFSDPTGQFEAVIFSDTLALAGEALEPGKAVLLTVEAELDGENVKTRVKTVQDLDAALGRSRSGLCIVADGRLSVEQMVKTVGDGGATVLKLRLRLGDPAREVELNLGGNFDVTPRQAGALKALPGVIEVVAF